MEFSSLASSLR